MTVICKVFCAGLEYGWEKRKMERKIASGKTDREAYGVKEQWL